MERNAGLMVQTQMETEMEMEIQAEQLPQQQQIQLHLPPLPPLPPLPQLPSPPPPKKRYWVNSVSNKYLLNRFMRLQDDRLTIAAMMIELAERAERNVFLQELLRKVRLPAPYDVFEYKRGNAKRKGHWARWAYTRDFPTPAQLEARINVAELSHSLFGTKGNIDRDNDTTIARINYIVGEELRGKKIVRDEDKEERKKLSRIVEIAGVLVQPTP